VAEDALEVDEGGKFDGIVVGTAGKVCGVTGRFASSGEGGSEEEGDGDGGKGESLMRKLRVFQAKFLGI
jgi:hypothetical protein